MRNTLSGGIGLALVTSLVACGGGPSGESEGVGNVEQAASTNLVSDFSPQALVQSTGNLYWTNNVAGQDGGNPTHKGTVYRIGKAGVPGDEGVLYTTTSAPPAPQVWFGAFTYAYVSGTYFGYFVKNQDGDTSSSTIERILLGNFNQLHSYTIATTPGYAGVRDLVNDGSTLFFADTIGIHSVPIGGGAVGTLASETTAFHVGIDGAKVYYESGAFIESVPKAGGSSVPVIASNTGSITALFVNTTVAGTDIYYGDSAGSVRMAQLHNPYAVTTYQGAIGRNVTSVSFDGTRVLWIDCVGGATCNARERIGDDTSAATILESTDQTLSLTNIQGDATETFWGENAIVRHVY